MTLLAHKDADGGVQTLRDHLHNAGDLAESYESEFSQIPRMAALLHDVGKVAQQFQTYLISGKGRRGEIPHARQGAFVVNDLPISNSAAEIVKEILELVIAKHHGELPDCINEIGDEAFLTGFTEADKQNPKYAYGEIKQGLHDLDLDLQDTFQQAEKDVFDFAGRTKLLKLSKDSRYFYSGLLVKYVYSRLIDADRTDTAYFETKEQYHPIKADWSELIRRLDESMKSFDSTSEINKIRQQITEQCRQAGSRETGIYRLSVPTGGGKTLASLNFALHHALETGKRRIIYVIPYLSITSQTVATFRNMLGLDADSNIVLEHYSTAGLQNSGNTGSIGTSEEEDAKERQRKLASERWDNPIIVTTMVEFLETVMSARGTKLRKFHNMANSVIIFDEIQSLPLNIINPFNEVVSFLSTILDSTILLCSATQPLLERTARKNLRLSDEPDLIDNTDGYEEKLKRTRIIASQESKSCEELANIIYEQALRNGNCLSIVNTKSEARKMYQCLQELNADGQFELIHLSTAMCGKHRADQLARIKVLTDPHDSKPVICVSTQLIEAGVDLSFACVVRAMAGLDSIMQAAGRCNRNGESKEIKDVYVYPLQGEERFKDYLPEIHRGKKLTLQIMGEHPDADLLSTGMLNEFYGMLLQSEDRDGGNSLLDGPLWKKENAGKTIYELLAYNESQRKQFENNTMGERYNPFFAQAFKTVGNEYRVIPKMTVDELRGVEGLAAKDYFYAFDDLVLKNKDDFFFTNRSRRPPLDRLNALLSFCYSILTNDCIAALQGVGLDPYVGFMHTDRPGRASLALDLVEEFRPVLADRFVLTLVNTGAVKPGDFEIRENGGVLLSDSGRKKVLTAWQKKKSDQILHPFLQEKISWGLVPYVQALLLARSLRGDLDDYPPFMWK